MSRQRRVVQAMPGGSEPTAEEIPVLLVSPLERELLCASVGELFAEQVISPGTGYSVIHNSKSPGYYQGLCYHRSWLWATSRLQGVHVYVYMYARYVYVCACICVMSVHAYVCACVCVSVHVRVCHA